MGRELLRTVIIAAVLTWCVVQGLKAWGASRASHEPDAQAFVECWYDE